MVMLGFRYPRFPLIRPNFRYKFPCRRNQPPMPAPQEGPKVPASPRPQTRYHVSQSYNLPSIFLLTFATQNKFTSRNHQSLTSLLPFGVLIRLRFSRILAYVAPISVAEGYDLPYSDLFYVFLVRQNCDAVR